MGGLLKILRYREPLRIQTLEERFLAALSSSCTKRRRRCRLGRRHAGEIDLAEARHGGHGALLGRAAEPAHRLHEALQDAPRRARTSSPGAAAPAPSRHASRQRLKNTRGIGFAILRIGLFRTLQRRRALEMAGKPSTEMTGCSCGLHHPGRDPVATVQAMLPLQVVLPDPRPCLSEMPHRSAGNSRPCARSPPCR
jgi:hypothetical protein